MKAATGTAGMVRNLASAFRTFSLYPEDHALSIKSVGQISSELRRYTETYDSLVLTVEKDGIYSGGQNVVKTTGDDDPFHGPLKRDGIIGLEFSRGIEAREIVIFFQILKKNKNVTEEADSDTVTDLWEADLPHIHFQASEFMWDSDTVFSFPTPSTSVLSFPTFELNHGQIKENVKENKNGWLDYEPSFYKPANLNGPLFDGINLSIHPDELKELEKIVKEQESGIYDDELVELLLFVLEEVSQPEDLKNILSSLADEFGRALSFGEMYKAYSIIEKISAYRSRHAWITPHVDDFFMTFIRQISGPVFQKVISGLIPVLKENNAGDIFFLRKIINTLESSAIICLCDILPLLESVYSRDLVLDIIKNKARDDADLINQMMASPDKMVVLIAISLLKKNKNTNSDYLLYAALKHPQEQIRTSALDYFLEKPVSVLNSLFFLINDPSMDIRIKLLKCIGSKRAVSSETLMLQYLESFSDEEADRNHLLNCYRMLGKCGSERSLAFLKKRLFSGAWTGILGNRQSLHRQGALLALSELGSPGALKMIQKAANSRSPLVRKAYAAMFSE